MTDADKPRFLAALTTLFAAWAKPVDADQAEAYWRYLRDLELSDALRRLDTAAKAGGRYVPSVGQVREAAPAQDTRTHRVTCDACDGTGWQPTTIPHPLGDQVSAVTPCWCASGDQKRAARTARRMRA
jgi:hypothetical protein